MDHTPTIRYAVLSLSCALAAPVHSNGISQVGHAYKMSAILKPKSCICVDFADFRRG